MDNITDEHLIAGRYRILDQIGKGGMSTVYLARDITLNKQWAIKEVRPIDDRAKRETVIRSLIDEANLIKRFDHPAIPRRRVGAFGGGCARAGEGVFGVA